jgi:hypothetical protein
MTRRFWCTSMVMATVLVAAGCGTYEPIIDQQNVDMVQYETDLAECRTYAEDTSPATDAAVAGGIGAAIGAGVGAAIGAITGAPGTGAAIGAIGGGASGAVGGGSSGVEEEERIVRNCLRGRGYSVLN